MVNKVNYFESLYRYTDPVRYFKENDPVYWEVDNIPIKQLEENAKFLKDQVEGLLGKTSNLSIDRSGFSELKPYVNGADNIVKVLPGRYSARINNAYSIDPVQFLTQTLGIGFDPTRTSPYQSNAWEAETALGTQVSAVLEKFKSVLEENALNMNGLAERAFTFSVQDLDNNSSLLNSTLLKYDVENFFPASFNSIPPYPGVTGQVWAVFNPYDKRLVEVLGDNTAPEFGFLNIAKAENEFIKKWRGIVRTAIVDVPNELTIEVPPYSADDFYYIDKNNVRQNLTSNYRIDLIFIYSKGIDEKTTTLRKANVGGAFTTISEPTLGLVKGAGIGVRVGDNGQYTIFPDVIPLSDENGTPLIIPSVADQASEGGINGINGSFPSPDDLMNLAPLISENLEATSPALIGQSILPVAYVVVRRTSPGIVLETDLIDIRPFFRTTELAYNERAGIAAAFPQISIANPVASEGYVDSAIRTIVADYVTRINTTTTTAPQSPRIVGSGYAKGGFFYGVEAVLGDFVRQKFNVLEPNQAKQQVISRYGYPQNTVIPDYPDWDLAEWCRKGNYNDKGTYPNDYINFHIFWPNNLLNLGSDFAARKNVSTEEEFLTALKIPSLGTDRLPLGTSLAPKGPACIYFVKKKFRVDRSQIPWAADYHVNVQLLNCAPLSCRTHKGGGNSSLASNASVWVDKQADNFTIFVSWVAEDFLNNTTEPGSTEPGTISPYPSLQRNSGDLFAGFSVITEDILSHTYSNAGATNGACAAGVAIYPTVSFQIYGIPSDGSANLVNANFKSPMITLK